ncbi:MAG: tRNA 2-thiouridine(34) synthase MnmA [bacterium]
MKKKVILGLSGGVDSSVAAIRLLEDGYEVVGCFMRNWDSTTNNDVLGNKDINNEICPQELDYQDAVLVADALGIPCLRVDFIEEYWNYVFKYFLSEYEKGRTPNPDIMCNKEIKFKAFLDFAVKQNADYIAMGHYAQVNHTENGSYLLRGKDNNKDQTYFLSQLSQEQIKISLFPIGDMIKSEVRSSAINKNLVTATKKDSTGICFIGERNFKQFLKNYLPAKPGKMVRLNGDVISKHDGLMYYTIGQRKGLEIGGLNGYSNEPWFVVGKDLKNNNLLVEQGYHHEYLYSNNCIIENCNWINTIPKENKEYQAKFRYREQDNIVTIKFLDDNKAHIFYEGVRAVTPGQACVIYDNEECLGGGIIEEVYSNDEKRSY